MQSTSESAWKTEQKGADDRPDALRDRYRRRGGKDSERGGGYTWDLPVLYLKTGEENHAEIAQRNGKICVNVV